MRRAAAALHGKASLASLYFARAGRGLTTHALHFASDRPAGWPIGNSSSNTRPWDRA
ncbi:hypothetical protein GQ55_2G140700 [Panicum hallii var. hallii]|uniref:Uncharacterized protein n=1 Tax=Panicum hallii var. hallii TaxID=1504633 RepID=A0A2T7EPN8_9POAL|nr:hypothetical protein GQ55_2G140700 [Panicum hallii var. hallii]